MARNPFGAGPSDFAYIEIDGVSGVNDLVQLAGGAVLEVWNARTGGTQYTDLRNEAGDPITVVTSSSGGDGYAFGQIPTFYGPDGVWVVWVGVTGGARFRLVAANVGDKVSENEAALNSHTATRNGHGTGLADLTDVVAGAPETRTNGHVPAWSTADGQFKLAPPATVSGAVLTSPPTVGGVYTGNVLSPPPTGQNNPQLRMQQPFSAGDTNPDSWQFFATSITGNEIKTTWLNGNNELRGSPSLNNRIAARFFEMHEALAGPSTGRFFELSTNPTNTANREPLFGAYGTGHATQPGWMVATRVLAGQKGVRAGGDHNGLTALNFRGQRASTGAPTTLAWVAGDVVIDSAGAVYVCTVSGTPGTWVTAVSSGPSAPTAFVDITPGASMAHGTKHAAARLDLGGSVARLRGTLTASGPVSSGATIGTIPTVANRPLAQANSIARYTGGGALITINTDGTITLGTALTAGQSVFLDSITYDKDA